MEESNKEINIVPTDKDRFWRTLFTVSIAFSIFYIVIFLLVLKGARSNYSTSILTVNKLVWLHLSITGVLAALTLYSSIRFPAKKVFAYCGVYILISLVLPAHIISIVWRYLGIHALSDIFCPFLCDLVFLLIGTAILLFLPRILKKVKKEVPLYCICSVIFILFFVGTKYFVVYLLFGPDVVASFIVPSIGNMILMQIFLMGFSYAIICMLRYLGKLYKSSIQKPI